jgi:uncharacterized protein YdhG (YjbR/CyaY superfamily)
VALGAAEVRMKKAAVHCGSGPVSPATMPSHGEETMVRYEAETVADYLRALTPERREALETLRSVVLQVAPGATETMRYGMPAYDVGSRELCLFASQKHYVSLYLDPRIVDEYRGELEGLSLGKGCVRFRRLDRIPLETIERMLREIAKRETEDDDGKG